MPASTSSTPPTSTPPAQSRRSSGRALAEFARREEVVIATKVFGRMRPGPNGAGLSRKAILAEIDASLRRLGTDYVDLYQIHRWDPHTPIEETMEALHDVVKAGKARYIGASSMFAWQFAKALHVAERHGWTRFVSMQNHYNLLYREEEREMLPLCQRRRRPSCLGARWRAAASRAPRGQRPRGQRPTASGRSSTANRMPMTPSSGRSAGRGRPRRVARQVALAWLLSKPVVTAPIVGATKVAHLDDAIAALDLDLTPDEIAALEAPYRPKEIAGHA